MHRPSRVQKRGVIRRQQVRQIGKGVPDGGHLPALFVTALVSMVVASSTGKEKGVILQNPNHPRLRLVEDQVVNLEVSVDQRPLVRRLGLPIAEKGHELLEEGELSDLLFCVHVLDRGLGTADLLPGGDLPVVEAVVAAEALQPDAFWVDAVEFGQGADGVGPDGAAVVGEDVGDDGVFEDAPVEELHDVEGGADDRVIFAEAVGSGHGDVGGGEGGDDAVLALDLVGGFGDELSGRLLAEDVAVARGGGELVGGV